MIFGDIWTPPGFILGDSWHEDWGEKGHFLQKGSQEGPRKGFGTYFKWIWEVFLSMVDVIFAVFWVSFSIAVYIGYAWNVYEVGMA